MSLMSPDIYNGIRSPCIAILTMGVFGLLFFFISIPTAGDTRDRFYPFLEWPDNEGVHINAHGGGILFHEGVYYWYGEHKLPDRSEQERPDAGVQCYSSQNLYNWLNEGLVFALVDDPESEIAIGSILQRPKVIYNSSSDRFVMYFKLFPDETGYLICYAGVASATSPTGPFEYHHRFLAGGSEYGAGDFALFQDEEGVVYHFCSRKPQHQMVWAPLTEDYLHAAADYEEVEGIAAKFEAPAIFVENGRYYMLGSGCTGWNPNAARYASAESIRGPWAEMGNPCMGINPYNGLGPEKTLGGQISFVLRVSGIPHAHVAMFDVWRPELAIEGGYIWLPVDFISPGIRIGWRDEWDLGCFRKMAGGLFLY